MNKHRVPVITTVWEENGRLYGKCDPKNGLTIFNLSKPGMLETTNFDHVVTGRELVKQYIKK